MAYPKLYSGRPNNTAMLDPKTKKPMLINLQGHPSERGYPAIKVGWDMSNDSFMCDGQRDRLNSIASRLKRFKESICLDEEYLKAASDYLNNSRFRDRWDIFLQALFFTASGLLNGPGLDKLKEEFPDEPTAAEKCRRPQREIVERNICMNICKDGECSSDNMNGIYLNMSACDWRAISRGVHGLGNKGSSVLLQLSGCDNEPIVDSLTIEHVDNLLCGKEYAEWRKENFGRYEPSGKRRQNPPSIDYERYILSSPVRYGYYSDFIKWEAEQLGLTPAMYDSYIRLKGFKTPEEAKAQVENVMPKEYTVDRRNEFYPNQLNRKPAKSPCAERTAPSVRELRVTRLPGRRPSL